ncbi:MAG: exodeoxyribonuclease III [Candidatus Paceibacterota bacterium]|jgi:exodeoxyribonuclease-3
MKIISWNVNGLRAFHKKGAFDSIFELDPDIFCLQETKAHPEQLPEEVRSPAGYHAFFDHSKVKKGYSGVAIFSKEKPEKIEYGIGISKFDDEGRTLVAYFNDFVLLNIYFPNGGGGEDRLQYKLEYYNEFLKFIENLKKQGKSVVFCGDVNTAHNEIDLARPKENESHTGFLRIERDWMDKLISLDWIDTFRFLNPNKIQYSWWDMKTFARDRNVGWRLDYFFVSQDLKNKIKKAEILDNMFGSDHCPVLLELK